MTQAAVAAQVHQTLDVEGDLATQITFDLEVVIDALADLSHLGVVEVVGHPVGSLHRAGGEVDRADQDPALPDLRPAQREAMDLLEALAEDERFHARLRLEAGDLLLVNNWVVLHRRDAFEPPAPGEAPRELLRLWLSVPNSRPLDPCFAAVFGSSEAGALRGGMRVFDA